MRGMNTIFNTNLLAADVLEGLKQMAVERLGEGGHCWRRGAQKTVAQKEQSGEELVQSLHT